MKKFLDKETKSHTNNDSLAPKVNIKCLNLNVDFSEEVQYNSVEFPSYIKTAFLSQYPNFSADSHWHDDIEFIYIFSGHMIYNINGINVEISEGNGIFVNSRQFHYGFSDDHTECEFLCILLHPSLLCSSQYIEQKYVLPVLSNTSFPYYLLNNNDNWSNDILSSLKEMYDKHNDSCFELEIESLFLHIWSLIYKNMPKPQNDNIKANHQLSQLKDMIKYIEANYKNKISLDTIASSGSVCKTNCCTIFQKYLKQTPILYLINYRLRKSIELMKYSNMNLTEISYECGFSGASYYAETFKKNLGLSPRQYKEKYIRLK